MRKLIYCFVVLYIGGIICDQVDDDRSLSDVWDYDGHYDYDFLKEFSKKLDLLIESKEDISLNDADNKVAEEIQQFREENEIGNDAKEELDAFDDYQVEDNRQKSQENTNKEVIDKNGQDDTETTNKPTESIKAETNNVEPLETNDEKDNKSASKDTDANADYALLWGDNETPSPSIHLPIAEDDKKIFNETQEILNGDVKDDYGFDEKQDYDLTPEELANIEKFLNETNALLAENEKQFDNKMSLKGDDKKEETSDNVDSETSAEVDDSEVESMDKAETELHEELQKLFDTFDKLHSDESKEVKENVIPDVESVNVLDYEEKSGKPYKEELALKQRVDQDDYELIDDSNLSDIFRETNDSSYEDGDSKEMEDKTDGLFKTNTNLDENSLTTIREIMYQNDALVDNEHREDDSNVEEFDVATDKDSTETVMGVEDEEERMDIKKKMVDELSSSELDDLLKQFAMVHGEDLDVHSDDFSKQVAPIHIKLSVDEPVVVTSPNYPNPYPTNNIVDWIFDGEGMGIELNITDFAVNGALGDYLLVKPGGVDETGHDGLVFSYRLTSERRYRFTDVNKMFIRFEAKLGMMFLRGFKLSVKMISSLPEAPEDLPEPEKVLNPPAETITLHLGGVSLERFRSMKEEFQMLIADMAAEYISDNKIDPGLNTTQEVTQIVSTSLCNINWPDSENCTAVTIGVPLTYEEDMDYRLTQEDLETMWSTYITRDPFALRLRRMGITEFAMVDDNSIMMVWLVIAAGVVISMAMLAFGLWRFSCFEDYTRMQAYSDTDSVKNEKRGLDLYPTPHQILPPLYSENDYKWADDSTRVDMGGFANKSYTRDDLYDFDSEEEAVPNRERFTSDV